jgi:DNA-binding protein YbaB
MMKTRVTQEGDRYFLFLKNGATQFSLSQEELADLQRNIGKHLERNVSSYEVTLNENTGVVLTFYDGQEKIAAKLLAPSGAEYLAERLQAAAKDAYAERERRELADKAEAKAPHADCSFSECERVHGRCESCRVPNSAE